MRLTIRRVNDALRAAGIDGELLKGNGYFYFWGPSFEGAYTTSVMVCHLTALTLDDWMSEARQIIDGI